MMMWLLFRLGDAEIVAPTVPGLEYTAPSHTIHYTAVVNRLQYTAQDDD